MRRWTTTMCRWAALPGLLLLSAQGSADTPPGRYQLDGATVTDTFTGLLWQRSVTSTTFDWAGAKTYCANLTLAGSSAWRLPTVKELHSIVDPTRHNPAVDPAIFPDTPANFFWTATPYVGPAPGYGWYVQFVTGASNAQDPNFAYHVRCVR